MTGRVISYQEALREAQAECLRADSETYLIGLGVPGPTGIFGTTKGLVDEFGADRVLDMPSSEGGMSGIALGTAICGMRPIIVHMRVDFAVLSMETLVNQAAKWHYMYGGKDARTDHRAHDHRPRLGAGTSALAIASGLVRPCAGAQGCHARHGARCKGHADFSG